MINNNTNETIYEIDENVIWFNNYYNKMAELSGYFYHIPEYYKITARKYNIIGFFEEYESEKIFFLSSSIFTPLDFLENDNMTFYGCLKTVPDELKMIKYKDNVINIPLIFDIEEITDITCPGEYTIANIFLHADYFNNQSVEIIGESLGYSHKYIPEKNVFEIFIMDECCSEPIKIIYNKNTDIDKDFTYWKDICVNGVVQVNRNHTPYIKANKIEMWTPD